MITAIFCLATTAVLGALGLIDGLTASDNHAVAVFCTAFMVVWFGRKVDA